MKIAISFYKFLLTGIVPEENKKLNINFIFSYLFLKLFVVFVFFLLKYLFFESSLRQRNEIFDDEDILKSFLNIVVLAPVFEEMIFRYHLNVSYRRIFISGMFACLLLYDKLIFLLILLIYLAILLTVIWKKINFKKLVFIYLSSTVFAIMHLISYPEILQSLDLFDIVLVILPHFVGGLLLAYVFIRNGIFTAILLHALWNLLPFISYILRLVIFG